MLRVICYRHGQSAANAGLPTEHPATIELTELGWSQARGIAQAMATPPEMIVTLPFTRAQQSAAPTARRFPDIPYEVWDIGEFTYLCPEQCRNTTAQQRKAWVGSYWSRDDADFRASEKSESFKQFIVRVGRCLDQLKALSEQGVGTAVLFGHGQFFQALRWMVVTRQSVSTLVPTQFKAFDADNWITNGRSIALSVNGADVVAF